MFVLNLIFPVCNVRFEKVAGKCYLAYSENLGQSIEEWSTAGPNRFYFTEAYNVDEKLFDEPPPQAMTIANQGKGKGKGKGIGKGKRNKTPQDGEKKLHSEKYPDYPTIDKCLQTFDVFAGCGGKQSLEKPFTHIIHSTNCLNNSNFVLRIIRRLASSWSSKEPLGSRERGTSCSRFSSKQSGGYSFLRGLQPTAQNGYGCKCIRSYFVTWAKPWFYRPFFQGKKKDDKGQVLPQRGEVELLCGGPPCQGFSGMNRFNSRQYSLFKNSLVVSYLSYCDYYRPKFFIMENVRNFVTFKRSMVLKLTLRCLVRMGYQCTYGILQAGNYGVPQTRRRWGKFYGAKNISFFDTHVFE